MLMKPDDIKLIVFLGNPGRRYENTRHNIAWMLADAWSEPKNSTWKEKFKGRYAQIKSTLLNVVLLRPETYMNLSGDSVRACAEFFKIKPDEILVVHDDLEMAFGYIGVKRGGGLAGHNGLRSIASSLGSRAFTRLRLGISRPAFGSATAHVLGKFTESEQAVLQAYIDKAAGILDECLTDGIDASLERYSKKMLIEG